MVFGATRGGAGGGGGGVGGSTFRLNKTSWVIWVVLQRTDR